MAIACAVARIALWSGFLNSDYHLIRCTTMGAILVPRHFVNDRSTLAIARSKGTLFGDLQREECQREKELSSGLSKLNRVFSYSKRGYNVLRW